MKFNPDMMILETNLDVKDYIFIFNRKDMNNPEKVLKLPDTGDYILGWLKDGSDRFLSRVLKVDTDNRKLEVEVLQIGEAGVPLETLDSNRQETGFLYLDYVIGPEIENGESYNGFTTKILAGSIKTSMGTLKIFRDVEPKVLQTSLVGIIESVYDKYTSYGLPDIFPVDIEFLKKQSTIVGEYTKFGKNDKNRKDLLQIFPKDFPYREMERLLWHELGHGIQFNNFNEKLEADWLQMYDTFNLLKTDSTLLKTLLTRLLKSGSHVENLLNPLENDILEEVFQIIQEKSNLSKEDVLLLISENRKSVVIKNWPKSVMLSGRKNVITKYAGKSWGEFWCESFSFFATGKKLYPSITRLVEDTLRRLQ